MSTLTASNAALLLLDIQPGIVDNSHTQSARLLKLAASVSVKAAGLLGIPAFVSVVPMGPEAPEPVSELKGLPLFARQHAGSFDQPSIREALAATGLKTLAIGGVVSEVAVLHGALTAIREGYTVHVLVDCCGGLSERTEQAAFRQIERAGGLLSSVASFYTQIAGDFTKSEGQQVLGLLRGLMAKES